MIEGPCLGCRGASCVLLNGCKTWPTVDKDIKCLRTFDHHYLRYIAGIHWGRKKNNEEVRKRVLGDSKKSLPCTIKRRKLRLSEHVIRMPDHRLPERALFHSPDRNWRKSNGGQRMTWQEDMKKLTEALSKFGVVCLLGWCPRDNTMGWLSTLPDMPLNRSQWCEC